VFTCLHFLADVGELLFPGSDFVYRDYKAGFYLSAAALATIGTLFFRNKRIEKLNDNLNWNTTQN